MERKGTVTEQSRNGQNKVKPRPMLRKHPNRSRIPRQVYSREKEKQIIDFCLIIKNFFPKEIITQNSNQEYQKLIKTLPQEKQQLINLLIHHLTLLNQNYRINRNGRIIEIAEEDILIALQITGNILNPKSFLTRIFREHLAQLQLHFKDQEFTLKQACKAIQRSKTNTSCVLSFFIERELLQITKIGIRGMYYYRLK
ncbi:hypothetical protein EH230_07925 [Flavobacterium columnare]|uniref:Uncharacterized protein n=1 Tax=Flavobacterium columnare TaxID=996 RepID=A0A437UB35_9FLAO|nr:hypothetical protein [Flavobacterium columnare]RVU90826.1 hypothetical protein EH230_07895 [Flavobacterium columnare]RVU90832.1 hypothetical protein EH230_07925 [Flavobacterium columnare]